MITTKETREFRKELFEKIRGGKLKHLQDPKFTDTMSFALDLIQDIEELCFELDSHLGNDEMIVTTINVPKHVLNRMRQLAIERANKEGGRPSVSALIVERFM